MTQLDKFPPEILLYIFSFLDVRSLLAISALNDPLYVIATDDSLWKEKLLRYFAININTHCFQAFNQEFPGYFHNLPESRRNLFYWLIEKDYSKALAEKITFRDLTLKDGIDRPLPFLVRDQQELLNELFQIAISYKSNRMLVLFAKDKYRPSERIEFIDRYKAKQCKPVLFSFGRLINRYFSRRQIPVPDESGRNILHWAIIFNQPAPLIMALIKDNPRLIQDDWLHNSALHFAAAYGHIHLVSYLLGLENHRSFLYRSNLNGNSALHFAIINQQTEAAKMLLDAGAISEERNMKQQTPFQLAWKLGNMELIKLMMMRNSNPQQQKWIQIFVAHYMTIFIENQIEHEWYFDLNQLDKHNLKIFAEIMHDILVPHPPGEEGLFPFLKNQLFATSSSPYSPRYLHQLLQHKLISKLDDADIRLERLKYEEDRPTRNVTSSSAISQFGFFAQEIRSLYTKIASTELRASFY